MKKLLLSLLLSSSIYCYGGNGIGKKDSNIGSHTLILYNPFAAVCPTNPPVSYPYAANCTTNITSVGQYAIAVLLDSGQEYLTGRNTPLLKPPVSCPTNPPVSYPYAANCTTNISNDGEYATWVLTDTLVQIMNRIGTTGISGTLTTNFIPVATGVHKLGNGFLYQKSSGIRDTGSYLSMKIGSLIQGQGGLSQIDLNGGGADGTIQMSVPVGNFVKLTGGSRTISLDMSSLGILNYTAQFPNKSSTQTFAFLSDVPTLPLSVANGGLGANSFLINSVPILNNAGTAFVSSNIQQVNSNGQIITIKSLAPDSLILPYDIGGRNKEIATISYITASTGGNQDTAIIVANGTTGSEKNDTIQLGAWRNWTSTIVGSGTNTVTSRYSMVGKTCTFIFQCFGTGTATNFTFTLPFISKISFGQVGGPAGYYVQAGNAGGAVGSYLNLTAGSNVCSLGATATNSLNGWTASGARSVVLQFSYEIQ